MATPILIAHGIAPLTPIIRCAIKCDACMAPILPENIEVNIEGWLLIFIQESCFSILPDSI